MPTSIGSATFAPPVQGFKVIGEQPGIQAIGNRSSAFGAPIAGRQGCAFAALGKTGLQAESSATSYPAIAERQGHTARAPFGN